MLTSLRFIARVSYAQLGKHQVETLNASVQLMATYDLLHYNEEP